MKTIKKAVAIYILAVSFLVSGCNPRQVIDPAGNPTPTITVVPTITSSATPKPIMSTTPTLGPVGVIQRIPKGFVYLGDKKTLALGFNMSAGGAIGSLLFNGFELVDHTDYGRYIQLSFYDGNDKYEPLRNDPFGNFGWNPVQAGSKASIGAKVLEYRTANDSIYIKARGIEWGKVNEDSDVIFETWAWQHDGFFEVHLRATHIGIDSHASARQEFPAAYFATSLTHAFGYFGNAPFTGASITELKQVGGDNGCPTAIPTENWAAFGTLDRFGLIIVVPPQLYLEPNWTQCLLSHVTPAVGYISPLAIFDVPPGAIREETIYLIPGLIDSGRKIVYNLIPHTTWTFDLNASEGWTSSSTPLSVENGILTADLSPTDSLNSFPGLHIPGNITPSVSINARIKDTISDICLHFISIADPYWDTSKTACVSINSTGYQKYTFNLKVNPSWNDSVITQLRLDAPKSITIEIDSMTVDTNGYAW